MAYKFTIPFFAFRLHLHSSGSLLVPMGKESVLRVGSTIQQVAKQYADALQRQVLNRGEISELLNEYQYGDFIKSQLEVKFPASKNGLKHPAFSLEFPFYFNEQPRGLWGILPSLQMEAYAEDYESLAKRLEQTVRLDFKRKKRLRAVQDIVSTIWFDHIELKQKTVALEAPSPKELEQMMKHQGKKLLPKVAQAIRIKQQAAFGRDEALQQLVKALKGNYFKNILLVGPTGVGKTALVWELARQRKKRRIKEEIWETSASILIKELMQDTGWQENLAQLCQEASASSSILFIRNLMDLFEVGKSEGNSISMAEYLRPFLSNGTLQLITECTEEELAQIELQSSNYIHLFQKITLEEPQEPKLSDIILKKTTSLASNQNISIEAEAIKEAIRLNKRFTPYAGLPGHPIRFLESLLLHKQMERQQPGQTLVVDKSLILDRFCEETGLPQFIIDPAIPMDGIKVKQHFNEQLYGQEAAVEGVVDMLATVKAALSRTGKPIASFLFVGPTGVGKTELAKILAAFMFGSRDKMTRFDMSEFSNPYDVQRLIGSAYNDDGVLTSAIRKEPFSVLLFDEVEKADPSFYDLLLQLLSEGRLTDNRGKITNFCSTIIIMTSNIGASNLMRGAISWSKDDKAEMLQEHFIGEVQKYFRPELYNRIDQVIPFAPLDAFTVRFVVEREITQLRKREGIKHRRMSITIREAVYDFLAHKGFDSKYGARHLQRVIRAELVIPLAQSLNLQEIDDQLEVWVDSDGQSIQIQVNSDPLGLELLLEEFNKINHADHASMLRRQAEQLKESHLYISLLNEIDKLERRKRKSQHKFWKNETDTALYTDLMTIQQAIESLSEDMQATETEIGLSCINAGSYNVGWVGQLDSYEKQIFDIKARLYSTLTPMANQCYIGIYGNQPLQVIRFYLQLLKKKGFQYKAYAVWAPSRASMSINPAYKDGSFYKNKIGPDEKMEPEHGDDTLRGLEIEVKACCAWLYFMKESGIQKWHTGEEELLYMVKVENTTFERPEKLHRKDFYQNQPIRRSVEGHTFKDNLLKLSKEYSKKALVDVLIEILDEQYKQQIEAVVF
jgi:ATP-dependent Clp protease ATP-binding subunit ClpA